MSEKSLIVNHDAIDEDLTEKFINMHDGLPVLLMNILDDFDDGIWIRRYELYLKYPELENLDGKEMEITSELLKEGKIKEAEDFQINYALDFLDKHPQFKQMIDGVHRQGSKDLEILLNSIKEAFIGDFDYF
ncbi:MULTISPECIES: hypothetical protein [Methanobrevibacter]|uniref:Uncharacterized protein n=1 Tax=Methanobrevibacter gottschalkii DSM 11977 TaxID=1122229 RepID=A0A3N5B1H9_9EURY|nr:MULTISPECIES: hypothetical protein [Methanobrevibacter]OED01734.1 hypothetical protein A9505_02085 [Methanobrevibacter sp. A27]RPF51426.1 hypothetical protein EDC42_0750 [Methanobrevibacter gottschalkii DSM 11977]